MLSEICDNTKLSILNESPVIIIENTKNNCKFNVMPDKYVEETLFVKEYKLFQDKIEAVFDREYYSDMEKSPNHLVFLTFLVHTQKMLYIYLMYLFNKEYSPFAKEKIKIWATKIDIDLPKLVTNEKNVTQTLRLLSLIETKPKQYITEFTSFVEGRLCLRAKCNIYDIE